MPPPSLDRLSLNQMTVNQWDLRQAVEGCLQYGIRQIGVWRHKVEEIGLAESIRILRDSGLGVSSLCRGGMFPALTEAERQARIDDNRRAIDEAAALGTNLLVLVCGPAPDRDLAGARRVVETGIEDLLDHAGAAGVRLGIEPLHPMFAADRSVIVTLAEALSLAEKFDPHRVGVVIDVYHVWWDPFLSTQIARAEGRIFGFHVNDWIVPPPDHLKGRGMMGDGVIDISRIREAVDSAGYSGPIECEIFNQTVWDSAPAEVMRTVVERYARVC